MHLLFDLLSHATASLLRLLIIACPILCIDLVCGSELIVLLDVQGGSDKCPKVMLVACVIGLAILCFNML